MPLPTAAQRKLEEAEQLRRQMYGETEPAPDSPEENPEPVEQPAASEPEPKQPDGEQPDPDAKEPDWKQKFLTLEGKYKAELPRLYDQIRDQDRQIGALQSQIQELSQKPPEPQVAPQADALPGDVEQKLQEFEEEYGPEQLDALRLIAQSMVGSAQNQWSRELESTVKPLKAELAQTKTERFWEDLERFVSDWSAINDNPAFHEWLGEYDPMAGMTRQNALETAQSNLDARRVIGVFNEFKRQQAPAKAGKEQQDNRRKDSLERQVAPGRSKGQTLPDEQPKYTVADWTALQDDARRGRYTGREAEFRQKEAEIHAAIFGPGA